jgi:hypothetical protein
MEAIRKGVVLQKLCMQVVIKVGFFSSKDNLEGISGKFCRAYRNYQVRIGWEISWKLHYKCRL